MTFSKSERIMPYNDEFMVWDDSVNKYFLTEKALIVSGSDIRAMLASNDTVSANAVINRIIKHVSTQVYNYIHNFSDNNALQDRLIATVPSLRALIYEALLNQAEYLLMVGDPTRTFDRDKRDMAIDVNTANILNTTVPELGVPIIYSGVWI